MSTDLVSANLHKSLRNKLHTENVQLNLSAMSHHQLRCATRLPENFSILPTTMVQCMKVCFLDDLLNFFQTPRHVKSIKIYFIKEKKCHRMGEKICKISVTTCVLHRIHHFRLAYCMSLLAKCSRFDGLMRHEENVDSQFWPCFPAKIAVFHAVLVSSFSIQSELRKNR
jgi:hypothetical protein